MIYVPGADGVLYALDKDTGQEVWRFTGTAAFGPVVIGGGRLVVSDVKFTLYGFTSQGAASAPAVTSVSAARTANGSATPLTLTLLNRLGIAASLPPHAHPLGHEWALDAGHEATVTIAPADGPYAAALIANDETSGLAAAIVTADQAAAAEFLGAYAGTGAFWNAPTRLLDGFKLLSVPETGINIDAVPGPRGPVTFRDLYLRQFVVTPA